MASSSSTAKKKSEAKVKAEKKPKKEALKAPLFQQCFKKGVLINENGYTETVLSGKLINIETDIREFLDDEGRLQHVESVDRTDQLLKYLTFEHIGKIENERPNKPLTFGNVFRARICPEGGIICTFLPLFNKKYKYKLFRAVKAKSSQNKIFKFIQIASSKFFTANTQTYIDLDVTANTTYIYRIDVTYSDSSTYTDDATVTYKEEAPCIDVFTAEPHPTQKKVTITYRIDNETTFEIFKIVNGKEVSLNGNLTDTDVENGKKYKYKIYAENFWGKTSKQATADCTEVRPAKVNLSCTTNATRKYIEAQYKNVVNVLQHKLNRRLQGGAWSTIKTTSGSYVGAYFTNTDSSNLSIGKTYEYQAFTCNEWGEQPSNVAKATFQGTAPNPPHLSYKIEGEKNVRLSCTVDSLALGYKIYRNDKPNSSISSLDTSTAAGQTYTYYAVAYNDWGNSDPTYIEVKIPSKTTTLLNAYDYIGQYPKEKDYDWADNVQGICHDDNYWYVTNGYGDSSKYGRISKFNISDIASSKKVATQKFSKYHFGDCDHYKGYIFVPVYENLPCAEIWIFRTSDLALVHREPLPKPNKPTENFEKMGWCAINPINGRLYTSFEEDNATVLTSFETNINNIATSAKVFTPSPDGKIYIYDKNGSKMRKASMQGGTFDLYNNLYLNSGYLDGKRDNQGIHVFKMTRVNSTTEMGVLFAESVHKATSSNDFAYQFEPGSSTYEEPEGLTFWDLTTRSGITNSNLKTSLHALLLDNDELWGMGADDVYVKHYATLNLPTETSTYYYHPSLIDVSRDASSGDWVVSEGDNIVKRFSTQAEAKDALNILKAYSKRIVIGETPCCDPAHKYEFETWEGGSTGTTFAASYCKYTYNGATSIYENGRYVISLSNAKKTNTTSVNPVFYAHNKADADNIKKYLNRFTKMNIIGKGGTNNEHTLIWFTK